MSVILDGQWFAYLGIFSQAETVNNFRVIVSMEKMARKYLNYIDCV